MNDNHNEIVEFAINLTEKNNLTCKKIKNQLNKYNIDINYDNSMILALVCNNDARDCNTLKIIRLLLELGANPNLIMENDLIEYDMGMGDNNEYVEKLTLDGLFRSFGYECNWINRNGEIIDFNKLIIDK